MKKLKNKAEDAEDQQEEKASGIKKAIGKVRKMTKINSDKKVVVPESSSSIKKRPSKID